MPIATYDVLALQSGTLDFITSLEAEVAVSDKGIPLVDLFQTTAEGVRENESA